MRFVKDGILILYWVVVRQLVRVVPTALAYKILKPASKLLRRLMREKTTLLKTVYRDLLPEYQEKDLEHTIDLSYWSFLCCEYEMLMFPSMNPENIGNYVSIRNIENLDNALEAGKGALLLFGHFGANLMVMPAIGYGGYTMNQLSAPATVWVEKIPDKNFSKVELFGMRKRWEHEQSLPANHINIFGVLKNAFLCLNRNEVIGVAIDGGGGSERITVDFLQKSASFSTGAAEIARRTGCAVLPSYMCRDEKSGKNELHIDAPYFIDQALPKEESHRQLIELFAKKTEELFIAEPWLYLNFIALRKKMEPYDEVPFIISKQEHSSSETRTN